MNTEQKKGKSGGVVTTILVVFTTVIIIAIFVVSVTWLMAPPVKASTSLEDYAELYGTGIEPMIARDETVRQVLIDNPEKLCICMHVSDVLMGTNFTQGQDEEELAEKLTYDPYMRRQYAENYFAYLDNKYN